MKVFLLDNCRSRSRKHNFFSAPAPAPTLQKIFRLRLRLLAPAPAPGHFQKPINQKFKVMIFFIKNEKKMNDSFAWTEQKLKRNLNSLSYFEKSPGYGSVSFG